MELAGLYMFGKAERWFRNRIPHHPGICWEEFRLEAEKRFRETEIEEIVEHLAQL